VRQFVHLHVHSEYSLLDGANRIERLCRLVAEFGSPALALTDHGVMYGAMEFYAAARRHGLSPIIGCEAYMAPRGRSDRSFREEAHVTLLAADLQGYRNLSALVSKGFLEGYYYKPRIDFELLEQHHAGLIVLSGCMSSLVAAPLLKNDRETSLSNAKTFQQIFGDRFYVEVMRHGMPEQEIVNEGLVSVARELGLALVATNDAHYLNCTDSVAHDVLLCIGTGRTVAETNRLRFATDQFYVKSPDEMYEVWSDLPEACENTVKLAERVDLELPKRSFAMPEYRVPADAAANTPNDYLRALCEQGLAQRYGESRAGEDAALRKRLDYELSIISAMGYASYFLIVWDFIKYARDRDIPVGPGRGSAAGSLVAYCLHITDLDPLAFDLLFERFLNPDRISMPDIDTDFCVERRDEVIAYVTEKYGSDRVAQIVTFGTMAARAAVRDAGRVLGVPLPDVDRVAKLIPSGPTGLSIEAAIKQIGELGALYAGNPEVRKLLDTAKTIEGLTRNAGTHAAGVVISDRPLVEHVPLVKFSDGRVNTQYDMEWIEKIGLLKMDFLGLRNLTVMHNAVREIRRTDSTFDLQAIGLEDGKTLDMLGRGDTVGVFQLESEGMKRVCVELQPSRFGDLIALVALYRPGPMEWIPEYINNKHGRTKPRYLHPKLESILSETYGIAVYQEQVMMIARDVAGFSMAEADELRKVMGKKLKDQVPIYRERFIEGAVRQGIARKLAEEIFAMIEPFAGYGFPKAHAAAYAMIAYQTAYLKANYPVAYITALLTSVKDRTEKLAEYIDDARHCAIAVLPPDVNESGVDFTAVGGQIRFGLSAIKGVGEEAVRAIIKEREREGPFSDLFDLARRCDARQVNRRVFEALIKCGATDALPGSRAQKLAALDLALDLAARSSRDRELGQAMLFTDLAVDAPSLSPALPSVPAPTRRQMLVWERETLGIFVSGHPLAEMQPSLERAGAVPIKELRSLEDDTAVTVGGAVAAMRRATTRAGAQMLIAQIEDATGSCEIVLFPKLFDQFQPLFKIDATLLVKGRLRHRERPGAKAGEEVPLELSIGVLEVLPFQSVPEPSAPVRGWYLEVSRREQIDRLKALIEDWPGDVPVLLGSHGKVHRLHRTIAGDVRLRSELERIFGGGHVREAEAAE
jgi:DNA polymerase-3 subunit alpha